MSSIITGNNSSNVLVGTNHNDTLQGRGGNDVLVGSRGSDSLDGGNGFDTADYTNLSVAVTLKPAGELVKGNFGTDTLFLVEQIRGAKGFDNVVDASSAGGGIEAGISLENQYLDVFNIPGLGERNFTIQRFVDVIGTQGSDFIEGSNASNFLDGQGGDDFMEGGGGADNMIGRDGSDLLFGEGGQDRLSGTDSFSRGEYENDFLVGGDGRDRFILGDGDGSYYQSKNLSDFDDFGFGGFAEFAVIDDLTKGERIEVGAGETYLPVETSTGFDLYVVRDGLFDGFLDAVAVVNTTSSINLPNGEFSIASDQTVGIFIGA
jgi:Ca2+-binding RTX toxin-like protein